MTLFGEAERGQQRGRRHPVSRPARITGVCHWPARTGAYADVLPTPGIRAAVGRSTTTGRRRTSVSAVSAIATLLTLPAVPDRQAVGLGCWPSATGPYGLEAVGSRAPHDPLPREGGERPRAACAALRTVGTIHGDGAYRSPLSAGAGVAFAPRACSPASVPARSRIAVTRHSAYATRMGTFSESNDSDTGRCRSSSGGWAAWPASAGVWSSAVAR